MDVNVKSPTIFNFAENDIKKLIKNHIHRGRVDIYIGIQTKICKSVQIIPNHAVLNAKINCLKEVSKTYELGGEVEISLICKEPDAFEYQLCKLR